MTFELNDIKAAHAKVASGADFPRYIQDLVQMGVKKYDCFVNNGRTVYFGEDDFQVKSASRYARINIANISDKERFKHYLKNHQRGQTDYPTFCNQCAQTGVQKWTVDMESMTCTYFDKQAHIMLEEEIPTPN